MKSWSVKSIGFTMDKQLNTIHKQALYVCGHFVIIFHTNISKTLCIFFSWKSIYSGHWIFNGHQLLGIIFMNLWWLYFGPRLLRIHPSNRTRLVIQQTWLQIWERNRISVLRFKYEKDSTTKIVTVRNIGGLKKKKTY